MNQLLDLQINEISLVDRPANPEARIFLFKRDTESQEQVMAENNTPPINKAAEAAAAPDLSAIEAHLAKADARMDELLTSLTEKNTLIEKMQAEIAQLKADNEQLQAGSVAKAETVDALDSVLKSVPDVVQKALNDLSERVEKAESESRRYAEQIEKAEWTKRAEPLVGCLPIAADALGGLLQRVNKGQSTAADAAELERVFKAVNAAAGQNQDLFREIGKADGATVTVQSRIEAMATDIRKADSAMSQEQAVAKVLTAHPELYVDYLAETRKGKA